MYAVTKAYFIRAIVGFNDLVYENAEDAEDARGHVYGMVPMKLILQISFPFREIKCIRHHQRVPNATLKVGLRSSKVREEESISTATVHLRV